MTITTQRGTTSPYPMATTRRGGHTMSISAHTIAYLLAALASVCIAVSGIVEALGAHHLAVALIVCGAVTASSAGMVAALDAARTHRK
jgi:NADH:ubiquinone oxidoreductase subunit 6 (subunit J)